MVTKEQLLGLTKDNPVKAYSGKVGCMCGCLGTYYYSSANDLTIASKNRGYEVTIDEVNDKLVSRVLNTLKLNIDSVSFGADYAYLEVGKKCWAVYVD